MQNSVNRVRVVRISAWCVLWTVVVLLLRIPPYIDRVFARDTVGRAYVPMGILAAVLAGLITTTLVATIITSRKHDLVLLPALSLVLIGGAAGAWMLIPREPFAGRVTVPAPVNVLLAILFGSLLFGLTLVGRRTLGRITLLLLSLAAVVLFERAWSSYSEIVWESQVLEVELSQLLWKIPSAAVLAGIASLITARERLGEQPRPAIRAITAALPIVAAALLLVPFRYQGIWTPDEIGTIQNARLTSTGDLALQVRPADGSPVTASALLVRRNGESVLRSPFRRPVAFFGGWEPWLRPRGSIQGWRVALMVEGSFWDFIRERPRSIAIGDLRTGNMETVCEEIWAGWRPGRMCQRAAIGPGRAWAVEALEESGSTVSGQLLSGSTFSVHITNSVSLLWFSAMQLQIVSIEPIDRKHPYAGTPHIDRVDLTTGKVTSATIPIGTLIRGPEGLLLDPRGTGFVAQIGGTSAKDPGTLFFIAANGSVTPLGTAPEWPLILWPPGQSPLVIDTDRLSAAFATQSRKSPFVRELTEVSGHVYALGGLLEEQVDNLYELDPSMTHASSIASKVRDAQWLPDSIVYVAAFGNGERVVRRWAATRKEDVLLVTR